MTFDKNCPKQSISRVYWKFNLYTWKFNPSNANVPACDVVIIGREYLDNIKRDFVQCSEILFDVCI